MQSDFGWGLGPNFFISGKGTSVSWEPLFLLCPFSSFCCHVCQPITHWAISEPTSSLVTPGALNSVPMTWLSTSCTCYLVTSFSRRIWSLVQHWTADSHQPVEMASAHGESFVSWTGFDTILPKGSTWGTVISVTLEEWWGNHEFPPESALVLIPIHWRCLKTVQGKMY